MKLGLQLKLALAAWLPVAVSAGATDAGEYVPRVEFGARLEPGNRIIHGAGQDPEGFDGYRVSFGRDRQPLIYMTYIGICHLVEAVEDWGARVRAELAAIEPHKVIPQIGLNMTGGKDDGSGLDGAVAAGEFDRQIAAFVDAVASFGRPVFLRIGYEFEGSWNNYRPETFPKAWVRVMTAVRDRALPVASVWCVAGASSGWPTMERLMEFYPGDEWVDWWGVDLFSEDEFGKPQLAEFLDAARARRKPVMVGEMTPRYVGVLEGERSWERWFAPMIRLLRERPEIKATAYINWEWREWSDRLGFSWHDWGDARIERDTFVRDAWVREHGHPIYLHATADGTVPLPEPKP